MNASKAAYDTCLRAHGAVIPTAKPTGKPSGKPTAKLTGTADAHKGGDTIPAAARAACASLKPSGSKKKAQA